MQPAKQEQTLKNGGGEIFMSTGCLSATDAFSFFSLLRFSKSLSFCHILPVTHIHFAYTNPQQMNGINYLAIAILDVMLKIQRMAAILL